MRKVVIMNFSHVYEREKNLLEHIDKWIECTDIKGTNCYLDEEAKQELCMRMKAVSPEGIHFIDSGNYHYVSKLWTDRITTPFSLILFDHHTDMQASMFKELLSCGCWVKEMLDGNPYLKRVVLVGAKEELIANIPIDYKERLLCFSEYIMQQDMGWKRFSRLYLEEPVYISVDKDVLNRQSVVTNWDQGLLSLEGLESLLHTIMSHERVIGIDICGESREDIPINDEVNTELVQFIRKNIEGGQREEVINY